MLGIMKQSLAARHPRAAIASVSVLEDCVDVYLGIDDR